MAQKIRTVVVTGADGRARTVALVRTTNEVAYVCSIERIRDNPENVEEWLVGFPLRDVKAASRRVAG